MANTTGTVDRVSGSERAQVNAPRGDERAELRRDVGAVQGGAVRSAAERIAGDGVDPSGRDRQAQELKSRLDREMSDPAKYDPKLAKLVDDIAHARPEDQQRLRDAIRRHFQGGRAALAHGMLSDVLESPNMHELDRQRIRESLAYLARR